VRSNYQIEDHKHTHAHKASLFLISALALSSPFLHHFHHKNMLNCRVKSGVLGWGKTGQRRKQKEASRGTEHVSISKQTPGVKADNLAIILVAGNCLKPCRFTSPGMFKKKTN